MGNDDITPGTLRHWASEPRQFRVIESVLNAAADKIERLERELAEFRARERMNASPC